MRKELPVFRVGTYPQGSFDDAKLQRAVDNTNALIKEKIFIPSVNLRHTKDDGHGWFDALRLENGVVFATIGDWSPSAVAAVREKRLRYVSSEISEDFNPTGETGKGMGPAFTGLALLNRPQVKGLVDLSTVDFADTTRTALERAGVIRDRFSDDGASYFAELDIHFTDEEERQMKTIEQLEADLQAERTKREAAEVQFAEASTKLEETTKTLTEKEKAEKDRLFAEQTTRHAQFCEARTKATQFNESDRQRFGAILDHEAVRQHEDLEQLLVEFAEGLPKHGAGGEQFTEAQRGKAELVADDAQFHEEALRISRGKNVSYEEACRQIVAESKTKSKKTN